MDKSTLHSARHIVGACVDESTLHSVWHTVGARVDESTSHSARHTVGARAISVGVGSHHCAHVHQRHLLVYKGESEQVTCLAVDTLAPTPAPSPSLPAPTGSEPKGAPLLRMSFRGGGLPVQVSARLTGVITHRGMWAPSLQLTGRHARLPVFPLPQPSTPPRLHSCPTLSPCPPFPQAKSETHQNSLSKPNSPTGGREWGRPAPCEV